MAYKQKGIDFGTGTGSSPLNKNGIFKSKKKKKAEASAAAERRKKRLEEYDKTVATEKTQSQIDREAADAKNKKAESDYQAYLAEERKRPGSGIK
jgi:nitrogen-specific signal transduction histidine kinase